MLTMVFATTVVQDRRTAFARLAPTVPTVDRGARIGAPVNLLTEVGH